MVSAMWKLTVREIRRSLGRFLAIVAIVALGVGFFCGLRLTKTAMVHTLDTYTETYQMYDFRLASSIGFDDTDAAAIAADPRVAACEGEKSADALASVDGGAAKAIQFLSLPEAVNLPNLKSGRMPQTADECLADALGYSEADIGKTVVLAPENSEDTLDKFSCREFTIVGIAKSVLYVNYERGSTSIGSGTLAAFMYVLPEAFDLDYDTSLYLRLQDRQGEIYSAAYTACIDDAKPWLTELAEQTASARAQRLYDDAAQELADARSTLDEKQQELSDAKKQLADAEQDYQDGVQALSDARAEADRELASAYQKLLDGQQQIDENEKKLAEARSEYESAKQQLDDAWAEYDKNEGTFSEAKYQADKQLNSATAQLADAQRQLDEAQAQLDQQKAALDQITAQIKAAEADGQLTPAEAAAADAALRAAQLAVSAAQAKVDASWNTLADSSSQLAAARQEAGDLLGGNQQKLEEAKALLNEKTQQLQQAQQELESGEQQLTDAKQQLAQGWADYAAGKESAAQEISDAEQQLADGKQQIADGRQELADGEQQLADAEQEYQDGLDALEQLKDPDVYVLDRRSNIGYACFESDSDIVRGVSRVFPLFFFAVAALVCITTMTRMVDEQRTQAGVLKALGYSNGAIMSVYFLYAGIASLLGCVIGIAAGSYFLPKMLWQGYNIMYGFSGILYAFDWPLALLSSGAYLLCALGTTWYVVQAELHHPAAELIRPKAPKAGKRILLERIPAFWNRLPFLHKVSVRNIMRYKKRMLMMVIGIGGCTALLITGYGIQDSISHVVDYQYDEITRYDASVTFRHALSEMERTAFLSACGSNDADCLFIAQKSLDAASGSTVKSTNVICPETGSVDGFIDLHTPQKEPIAYPADGACIISRGLAKALHLAEGDTITLQTSDLRRTELTVSSVFENYVYNYVYLTADTWQTVFGAAPEYEAAWVNFLPGSDSGAASVSLAGEKNVAAVSLSSDFRNRVSTMMQSLQYIVLVVVVCAAALAFIVLYNLTNINITEREREIATIKVLGFYDKETNRYIFRENIILTVLGTILGLPMGKALHAYVMEQIKIDMVCFDVRVELQSYLISAALTIVFGLLVNLVLRRKIRAVDMAQALKSIE